MIWLRRAHIQEALRLVGAFIFNLANYHGALLRRYSFLLKNLNFCGHAELYYGAFSVIALTELCLLNLYKKIWPF
jgi:hypothetical protein